MTSYAAEAGRVEIMVSEMRRRSLGYETMRRRSMYIGEKMPDFNLKFPNFTADISCS